ncbi:unnamed protein product [Musa acuminata var. zebrina]
MTLMNRSPYVSLLFKALAFIPRRRPADAAVFLSTHSFSAASGAPQSSFMAEYLVSSCGFDPDEAAKASKLLRRIESRHQPDSVLGFFKSHGFEDDFLAAVRKAPTLVACSLKNLQRKMEFLVNETRCCPYYLARRPWILSMSLEKRLIPRYRILMGLKSRGVHIGNLQMDTYMSYAEKKFLERFIFRYKEFPELIELYNIAPKTEMLFDTASA